MPFGKHHIDPAQIEAMRSAFHKVRDALMLRSDGDDPMTEIIVTKIVARKPETMTAAGWLNWSSTTWLTMAFRPHRSRDFGLRPLRRQKPFALAPIVKLFDRFALLLIGHTRVVVPVRPFQLGRLAFR